MTDRWYAAIAHRVPDDDVATARTLAAATLYEANGQQGALDPAIRQMGPGLMLCGNAFTVRCQAGDNLTLHAAVALASPGDVIVADVGDFADAGHWGEILSAAAISRQIAGLVINGGVRDVVASSVRGFPVFARAVSVKAATKLIRGLVNHPVTCGGVMVNPGDLMVGDEDGVVAIPRARVSDVLARASERESNEAVTLQRLREGDLTVDLLNLRSLLELPGDG